MMNIRFKCFFTTIIVLCFALFACKTETPQTKQSSANNELNASPAKRKQFADGLSSMTNPNSRIKNAAFSVGGVDNDQLILKGENISRTDCEEFVKGEYGQTAKAAGFVKISCRNNDSINEYNFNM